MSDPKMSKPESELSEAPAEVYCRRVQRPLPTAEHASCPYCFGQEADIRTGEHEKFCDYTEGKDPINFGFPRRR
jgi:Zn finger protein HypA/HybF involved in hydrogenase expression